MEPDNNTANETTSTEDKGLPPVAPPSGKHIIQLFLVPGVIVAAVVAFLIGAQWIFGVRHTPEKFLKDLNDPSFQVRWRAASDLSQVLPRDNNLASNPALALALAKRLEESLAESERVEEEWKEELKAKGEKDASSEMRKRVQLLRSFNHYLILGLGQLIVPSGIPVLDEVVNDKKGTEPAVIQERRYKAVMALGLLGERCKLFYKLPPEKQSQILETLKTASEQKGDTAKWAALAHDLLTHLKQGERPTSAQVQAALEVAASDPDPQMRHLAAWSLRFWDGNRIEDLLEKLARDDGAGDSPVTVELEKMPAENRFTPMIRTQSQYRRLIRYQAVMGLAMRGSPRTADYLHVLKEMLDVDQQMKDATMTRNGKEKVDSALVQTTLIGALRSLRELAQHQPAMISQELRTTVDALAKHPNSTISTEARATQLELKKIKEK